MKTIDFPTIYNLHNHFPPKLRTD